MKILFIGPLPDPITGQSLACEVLLASLRRDHEVTVVNLSKRTFRQGISSLGRIWEVLLILFDVTRLHRDHEVVYLTVSESIAGNLKDLAIYAICGRRLETVVIHLHGGAGLRELLKRSESVLARINSYFLKRIGASIVLGPSLADIFSRLVARERLHVVPNFAEDGSFLDECIVKDKFKVTSPTRLLFLSNLIPGKGHAELLQAFRCVQASLPGAFSLDFAGGFESESDEKLFRAAIANTPNAHYLGIVRGENKKRLFREAHVFCLPTYYPYEGQPISILEAYAAGCVVVTTDHSGIPDIFAPGLNGFQVEPRSVEALVECFFLIHRDVGVLTEYGMRNRLLAGERFRAARFCSDVEEVLHSVRSRARVPTVGAAPEC